MEKKLHCIRIGDLPAPMKRINSRIEKHPNREYKLRSNDDLYGTDWINQKAIDVYLKRKERSGIADIMRYEILFKHGGAMHGADSECLNPIDELFEDGEENYAVDTSRSAGNDPKPENVNSFAPLYACKKGSKFAKMLIDEIGKIQTFRSPPKTVGNRLMQKVLNESGYKIKVRPQHYFLPVHYNGRKYLGNDKIFATHYRGTSKGTYDQGI